MLLCFLEPVVITNLHRFALFVVFSICDIDDLPLRYFKNERAPASACMVTPVLRIDRHEREILAGLRSANQVPILNDSVDRRKTIGTGALPCERDRLKVQTDSVRPGPKYDQRFVRRWSGKVGLNDRRCSTARKHSN